MIVVDCVQRSEAWFAARLGKLTGSKAADMLAAVKEGEAAKRRDLRVQLVIERLTGVSQDRGYVNAEMQRGIDLEPAARMAYEVLTGRLAIEHGFCQHDTIQAGCSPDGLADADTLVSLKCPKSATHLKYLRDGVMPRDYVPQMLHEFWITGARFYDFLSYDDRFSGPLESLRVFYVRVERDQNAVDAYVKKAMAFLDEVERECEAVATMANLSGQLAASVTA